MFENDIIKEISPAFLGTILALLSTGLIWLLKSSFEKHNREMGALGFYEKIFVQNIRLLADAFENIDSWITSMKAGRSFVVHFEPLRIDNEELQKISNLSLVNQILRGNYMFGRTSSDISMIYSNYRETISKIDSIVDEESKKKNLDIFYGETIVVLTELKKNYEPLEREFIETIALIRVNASIRFHSISGYVSLLMKDIFPKVTKKALEREREILKSNLERISNP